MPPQSEAMDPPHQDTPVRSCLPLPGRSHPENNNSNNNTNNNNNAAPITPSDAPRSVYLTPEPLTRELSDLSGSYANGASFGKDSGVPGVIYSDDKQHQQPQVPATGAWRQAYVVSKLPPPPVAASKTKTKTFPASPSSIGVSRGGGSAAIMTSRDESVEVVVDQENEEEEEALDLELQGHHHNRIPVTVLLMNESKHTYELLQVWIDRTIDSVRDVIHAVQRGIPAEQWKTAYDGIFQVRGNRFTQLIHILRMNKYDIQPHEILVAKPWAMTAKVAIACANSAIRHLTNIQIINTDEEDNKSCRGFPRPKPEGVPLVLSNVARKRIYSPDGVLSHHHATQFLTFAPPFESSSSKIIHPREVSISRTVSNDDVISTLGSNISSVTGPNFQGYLVEDLIASLLPKSIGEQQEEKGTGFKRAQETSKPRPLSACESASEDPDSSTSSRHNHHHLHHQAVNTHFGSRSRRNNVSFVMSQLNCFKTRERVAALACCPDLSSKDSNDTPTASPFRCCTVKDSWNPHHHQPSPLMAVDEEEGASGEVRDHVGGHNNNHHHDAPHRPLRNHSHHHYHDPTRTTRRSSEDAWLSDVDNVEGQPSSPKYMTRGKKRFLRLEI